MEKKGEGEEEKVKVGGFRTTRVSEQGVRASAGSWHTRVLVPIVHSHKMLQQQAAQCASPDAGTLGDWPAARAFHWNWLFT